MNKVKKIPMRKCLATGEMKPKKEMIRIVRTAEGEIFVDPTGKKNGRGAYLILSEEAIQFAKKKKALERQFEMGINEQIYSELLDLAAKVNK
jgi:predicted RNA-binding protein YlxR (DUF448 family)